MTTTIFGIGHNGGPDTDGAGFRAPGVFCGGRQPGPGVSPGSEAAQPGTVLLKAASARGLPPLGARWSAMRDEMKGWLRAKGLSGGAVLMIGESGHECGLMAAGGLAGFPSGRDFFAGTEHAV